VVQLGGTRACSLYGTSSPSQGGHPAAPSGPQRPPAWPKQASGHRRQPGYGRCAAASTDRGLGSTPASVTALLNVVPCQGPGLSHHSSRPASEATWYCLHRRSTASDCSSLPLAHSLPLPCSTGFSVGNDGGVCGSSASTTWLGPIDGGNQPSKRPLDILRATGCAHWPTASAPLLLHHGFIGARLTIACPLSSRSQAVVDSRPTLIRPRPQRHRRDAAQLILVFPL
jgi:hypothetical protein